MRETEIEERKREKWMNSTYIHINISNLMNDKSITCLLESVRDKNRETEREGEIERKRNILLL